MDKVLTVSIAAYNVEDTIEDAIKSCIVSEALLDKIEIIAVDDGSGDGTLRIVKEYEKQYPGVVRAIAKENGGYGSTINASMKVAKGKYFKLLDGDDRYDTKQLENLLTCLENCESDMIITDYTETIDGAIKRIVAYKEYESGIEFEFQNLKDGGCVEMHSVCYKTNLLKDCNITITENCFYTDREYLVYPMPYVNTITYFGHNVYCYNLGITGQSVSKKGRMKHIDDSRKVYNNLVQYMHRNQPDEAHISELSRQLVRTAGFHINSLLCFPMDVEKRNEIIKIDTFLKKEYPDAYKHTKNKMVQVLKKNVKILYPLAVLYYKRKK